MTPIQQQAFFDGSGIHAASLNFLLRLSVGLLVTVAGVFIMIGLIKLLEDGGASVHIRFLLYLFTLSVVLMLVFTFIAS